MLQPTSQWYNVYVHMDMGFLVYRLTGGHSPTLPFHDSGMPKNLNHGHNCLTHVLDNYIELVMLGQDLNIGRVTVITQGLGVELPQI